MVWYRFVPGWQILLLPLFVVLALLASLGPGLWITALNVKYRDFRYVIPFIVQFGLYVSPVGFSQFGRPGRVALALQPEPDGRHHRRLPLVHPRRREPALPAGLPVSLGVVAFFLWLGISRFRATETKLRGPDLRCPTS